MAYDFQQLRLPPPPRLPDPPVNYDVAYHEALNNTLRQYFQRVDAVLRELVTNLPPVP